MYSILELKTKNEVGVERSNMVVTKVRSMNRQLRPLKAENQLQELNGLLQVLFTRIHLKIMNLLMVFWQNEELVFGAV